MIPDAYKVGTANVWEFDLAVVTRVVDGDSLYCDVIADIGFNDRITRNRNFRIFGINAREKSEPGGPEAKANLERLLPQGTSLGLSSVKADKYGGRYDAILTMLNGHDVASLLVADGWAARWDGKGTRPLPPWPRRV